MQNPTNNPTVKDRLSNNLGITAKFQSQSSMVFTSTVLVDGDGAQYKYESDINSLKKRVTFIFGSIYRKTSETMLKMEICIKRTIQAT